MAETGQRALGERHEGMLPYVFVEAPRCPACGGTKLRSYRSKDQGDGTRAKWTQCQDDSCGEKFILILE